MNLIFILKLYETNIGDQDTKTYQLFAVPIGNVKITEKISFCPEAPVLQYHQQSYNSCCLSILASAFYNIGDKRSAIDLKNRIEESLTL